MLKKAECEEDKMIGLAYPGHCHCRGMPGCRDTRAVSTMASAPCSFSPCQAGGSCEEHDGTFTCHCVQGRSGKHCQEEVGDTAFTEAGFLGQSYAALRPVTNFVTRTSLQLAFRTFNKDGLIFLATQRESFRGDFLSISLVGGHVEVKYDLGSGPSVLSSSQPVSLGSWHSLVFRRYRQDGVLQVDREQVVRGRSPGRNKSLNIKGAVYVGGHPSLNNTGDLVGSDRGLEGCIKGVRIQGQRIRIGGEGGGGVVPCSSHPCREGHCKNKGQCSTKETKNDAVCTCRQGFRGSRCHKRKKTKVKRKDKRKKWKKRFKKNNDKLLNKTEDKQNINKRRLRRKQKNVP